VALAGPSRRARRRGSGGRLAAACAVAVTACSDSAIVLRPVIDVPTDDQEATATDLDEISLQVAHAGSTRDLVSQTFRQGQALEMPDVPFGDDLVIHMAGFVGSSTVAYGRTCQIAVTADTLPTPHLFFSRTVKFANLDIAPVPRTGGLGVAYLGGALLVGGTSSSGAVLDVEHFDPLTNELHVIGSVRQRDRAVQALIGTSPPRVVVVGGLSDGDGAKFVEVLDEQRIERFDITDMARVDLTATALTDGRVMVIGGNPSGQAPLGEIDEIVSDNASFDVRKLGTALKTPRSRHTATRLGDDVGAAVLIAGGVDAIGAPVATAELFKPLSEELADPDKFKPTMNVPRSGHVAALMPDGSVLFIGGVDAAGNPVNMLELFSVDGGFIPAGEMPEGAGLIDFAATTLPDGRILLTGGRSAAGATAQNTAYIVRLNPLDGTVDIVAADRLALARAGHQALLLCDGTVLISGGTAAQLPAERYNPPPESRR